MKQQTFEQFLAEEVHAKLFPMVLDDDLPDHFDNWLGELQADDYLSWGELYGKAQYLAGKEAELSIKSLV